MISHKCSLFRAEKILGWLTRSNNLLEIGCSEGYNLEVFKPKAENLYGVEPHLPAVEAAKNKFPNFEFYQEFAEQTHFKDNFFDNIILIEVFEHVTDEIKTLNEAYRILNAKGNLILTTPHKGPLAFLDPENIKFRFKFKLKGRSFREGYEHTHRHYNLNEIMALLDKSKFKGKYIITHQFRSGFILSLISTYLQILIKKIRGNEAGGFKYLKILSALDYRVPFGPYSLNLALCIKKIK